MAKPHDWKEFLEEFEKERDTFITLFFGILIGIALSFLFSRLF